MKYTIYGYRNGSLRNKYEANAKSHKQAVEQFREELECHTHMKVVGKSVKRYEIEDRKIKELKGEIKIFKIDHKNHPSILILIGNIPEIKHYANSTERDKVYEEHTCLTVSIPAESAKSDKEQTDITASSEETSASKNGLTSKKIWNGFVMSATWQDLPTRLNTVKSSGKGKSSDTEESTWNIGYTASRSKQSQILYAKVDIKDRDKNIYPTVASGMMSMNGKIIKVKKVHQLEKMSIYKDEDEGFYWNAKWLDFSNLSLYLTEDLNRDKETETSSGIFKVSSTITKGLHRFTLCSCGCGLYISDGSYVDPSLLSVPKEENVETKKVVTGLEEW